MPRWRYNHTVLSPPAVVMCLDRTMCASRLRTAVFGIINRIKEYTHKTVWDTGNMELIKERELVQAQNLLTAE